MPRVKSCPLGFDNLQCDLPTNICQNYFFCILQVAAWELPYKYENGALIVKSYGYAVRVSDCHHGSFNSFLGVWERFYILDGNPISQAWQSAGWIAAEPWPFDPIPF